MKNRQLYNFAIANELLELIIDCPDLRFIQALYALNIVDGTDKFYEEPDKTLGRVKGYKTPAVESKKGLVLKNIEFLCDILGTKEFEKWAAANAGCYTEEDKQILHFLNGFNMAEKLLKKKASRSILLQAVEGIWEK